MSDDIEDEERVLGSGKYGCAVYPAKSCKPPHNKIKNHVAKVFYDKSAWEDELKENNFVKSIDPEGKFTLLSDIEDSSCKIDKIYDLYDCDEEEGEWEGHDEYYQIIYKMGGKSLATIVDNEKSTVFKHNNPDLKFSYVKYLNAFKPLLVGFNNELWKSAKKSHLDIKAENITTTEDGKGNLIDFGLMMDCKDIYSDKPSKLSIQEGYLYWPPEFKSYWFLVDSIFRSTPINSLNDYFSVINKIKDNKEYRRSIFSLMLESPHTFMNYRYRPVQYNLIYELENLSKKNEKYKEISDIVRLHSEYHIEQLINEFEILCKFLKQNEDTLEEYYNNIKLYVKQSLLSIFVNLCSKIDIYMLGLAMLEGLIIGYGNGLFNIDERFEEVIEYISHLINFNMFQRYNPQQALNSLNELIEKINQIENINLSSLRGGSFIRKIKFIHGVNSKKQQKNRKNKNKTKTKKSYHKKQRQTKRKNKYLNKNKKNRKSLRHK